MFSFVKSMVLQTPPIVMLQSQTAGVADVDWYAAQVSMGDPLDGVARTLLNGQATDGHWYAHNFTGTQYPFETAWAILMFNPVIFQAGGPVAVAQAIPNPAVVGQTITLDGTGSVNPDEGLHEPGLPGDTIQSYLWDLDGDGTFGDAVGSQPDVTAIFTAAGVGDYLIRLQVTDTTATSFPSSGMGDLSDTDSAQVSVKSANDAACAACIKDLRARAKRGKVQLVWGDTGADHYNVYRSTTSGGPYTFLATTTSRYSTYLDRAVTNGTTYYYVVRPAAANNAEFCQSNEASAKPVVRRRRRR